MRTRQLPAAGRFFSTGREPVFRDNGTSRGYAGLALGLVLLGGLIVLPGCQAPAQPTGPTELVLHVPDYETFFDRSLSVLRLYDFPPDRVDRVRGLIVSRPATSGQWFEWWRADSRGGYQLAESSLHTMRRIVTVNIQPAGDVEEHAGNGADQPPGERAAGDIAEPVPENAAGPYRLRVQVDKARYTAPERQITTTSGALAIYSDRVPTVAGLRGRQSRGAQWVPLGRDPLLESFLLERISTAAADVKPAE